MPASGPKPTVAGPRKRPLVKVACVLHGRRLLRNLASGQRIQKGISQLRLSGISRQDKAKFWKVREATLFACRPAVATRLQHRFLGPTDPHATRTAHKCTLRAHSRCIQPRFGQPGPNGGVRDTIHRLPKSSAKRRAQLNRGGVERKSDVVRHGEPQARCCSGFRMNQKSVFKLEQAGSLHCQVVVVGLGSSNSARLAMAACGRILPQALNAGVQLLRDANACAVSLMRGELAVAASSRSVSKSETPPTSFEPAFNNRPTMRTPNSLGCRARDLRSSGS